MTPFTDYLNTSHPLGSFPFVRDAVMPVLEEAGITQRNEQIHDLGSGTVKITSTPRVGVISLSGAALAHLRALRLFGDYLASLGHEPHTVTLLHVALDTVTDAPSRIQTLYRKAKRGQLQLSRKTIDPRYDLDKWLKPGVIDGRETGTLYIGPKSARVRAAVYDKRNERILAGAPDPGPLLRYEMRLKHVGATLRDAYDPTPLFWHYAAPDLLTRPQDVPDWTPLADGYDLPPMRAYSTSDRLLRIVENSLDLTKAFDLAASLGPHGIDFLLRAIRTRYTHHLAGQPLASGGPEGTERSVASGALEQAPAVQPTSTLQ